MSSNHPKWAPLLVAAFLVLANGVDIPKGVSIPAGVSIPKGIDMKNLDKKDFIDEKIIQGFKIGDGKELDEHGEVTCIAMAKGLAMKGLPALNACMKEMQLTIGKLRKKLKQILPCMVKCIGIKIGILLPDGHVNLSFVQDIIMENIPNRLKEFIWKVFDACIEIALHVKPNDPTCKTYRPLIKCLVDATLKIASQLVDSCPDVPDVIRNAAKGIIKSKDTKKTIYKMIT